MRALFWKTYPGTLSPSVDFFFFFLPGLQPNQVWECFTLHTGNCLPGSHTLLSHQLELSPAANTPQEEEYSSTGDISAARWVLNLNGKLYYWECLFYMEDASVIQNLPKSLQSRWLYLHPSEISAILEDSTWTYFILSRQGKYIFYLTVKYLMTKYIHII